MPKRNSSVLGREYGDGVRQAIEQTGLTQRKLAELLDWQEAKVSDLVRGKGGVSETDLRELLAYCRVHRDEVRCLLALHNESRERGYLQFVDGGKLIPLRSLIGQERLANKITTWSLTYLPGLLQIAAYVRALIEGSSAIEPAHADAVIRLKVDRQKVFHRSREFIFYVHENALRLPVGGPEVMQAQLLNILTMSMRPYITVKVVPIAIGAHAGGANSFVKLEYHKFPSTVWLESLRTGLFLDDKDTLSAYADLLKLLDQQPLDVDASRELIISHLPLGAINQSFNPVA